MAVRLWTTRQGLSFDMFLVLEHVSVSVYGAMSHDVLTAPRSPSVPTDASVIAGHIH